MGVLSTVLDLTLSSGMGSIVGFAGGAIGKLIEQRDKANQRKHEVRLRELDAEEAKERTAYGLCYGKA